MNKKAKLSPQQEQLASLLIRYVPLTYDSVTQHSARHLPSKPALFSKTATNFGKTGFSTVSCPGALVSHDQVLYSSLETSKGVLANNRSAYVAMMNAMRHMERAQYKDSFKTAREYKLKLDFFRTRRRTNLFRNCRIAPRHHGIVEDGHEDKKPEISKRASMHSSVSVMQPMIKRKGTITTALRSHNSV